MFSLVAVMSSVLLRGIDCNNWLNNSGRLASTMERGGGRREMIGSIICYPILFLPLEKIPFRNPPSPHPLFSVGQNRNAHKLLGISPPSCPKSPTPNLVTGKKGFYKLTGKRAPLSNAKFPFSFGVRKEPKTLPFLRFWPALPPFLWSGGI